MITIKRLVSALRLVVLSLATMGMFVVNTQAQVSQQVVQSDTALGSFATHGFTGAITLSPESQVFFINSFSPRIPSGKRFVIERVTGQAIVSGGQTLTSMMLHVAVTAASSCDVNHVLTLPTPIKEEDFGVKLTIYNIDLTRRIYADRTTSQCGMPSTDFSMSFNRSGSNQATVTASITLAGYLVDLPTTVPIIIPPTLPTTLSLPSTVRVTTGAESKRDWKTDTDFNIVGSNKRWVFLTDNWKR